MAVHLVSTSLPQQIVQDGFQSRPLILPTPHTTNSGIITRYQSLKALLSIGFDTPVALVSSLSLPLLYGNTGFLSMNINISRIPARKQPTQLENVKLDQESYSWTEFLDLANQNGKSGVLDKVHLAGFWTMAARGRIWKEDVEAIQRGDLMERLQRRRRDRSEVLPLWRGGPISVAGHSWFVNKLFGVQVYQSGAKHD